MCPCNSRGRIKGLYVRHEGERIRALFTYLGEEREIDLREELVEAVPEGKERAAATSESETGTT